MSDKTPDVRPKCPKCGEPAREVLGTAHVEALLETDGKPGRVLRAWRFMPDARYVCGGGHDWKDEQGSASDDAEADR